jgi:hypothetical protein
LACCHHNVVITQPRAAFYQKFGVKLEAIQAKQKADGTVRRCVNHAALEAYFTNITMNKNLYICLFVFCVMNTEGSEKPFLKDEFFFKKKTIVSWVLPNQKNLKYDGDIPNERITSHKAVEIASKFFNDHFTQNPKVVAFAFRRVPASKNSRAWCWRVVFEYPKGEAEIDGSLIIVTLSHKGKVLMKVLPPIK